MNEPPEIEEEGIGCLTLQRILFNVDNQTAIAIWNMLAQAVDNEASRDDVEDPYKENPDLKRVEDVVDLMNAVLVTASINGQSEKLGA